MFTLLFFVIPHGFIFILGKVEPSMAQSLNPYAWVISDFNNSSNVFIFGIGNGELKPVLKKAVCLGYANTVTSGNKITTHHHSRQIAPSGSQKNGTDRRATRHTRN